MMRSEIVPALMVKSVTMQVHEERTTEKKGSSHCCANVAGIIYCHHLLRSFPTY